MCATLRARACGLVSQGGEWDARKKAFVFQRYCHVYAQGDLRKLFEPLSNWVVRFSVTQSRSEALLCSASRFKTRCQSTRPARLTCARVRVQEIAEEYYDAGNWCVIARRLQ